MNANELVDEALKALTAGKSAEALAIAEKVVEAAPDDAGALLLKGTALVACGEHEKALEALERSIALDGQEASTWFQKGLAHEGLGQRPLAIDAYTRATQLDPEKAAAWRHLSFVLAADGQYASVLPAIRKAMELEPDLAGVAEVVTVLCMALNETGNPSEALKVFEETTQSHPGLLENGYLRLQEGVVRNTLGEPEKALQALQKAEGSLTQPGDLGFVRLQEGLAQQRLGEHEKALGAFEKAAALLPAGTARSFASLHSARSHLALNDRPAANEALNRGEAEPGAPPEFFVQKAALLNMLGRAKEALGDLDNLITQDPTSVDVWRLKAQSLVLENRLAEALDALGKAIELAPEGPGKARLWFDKAAVLSRKGDFQAALAALDEASSRDSNSEKVPLFLALKSQSLLALGRRGEIAQLFEKAAGDAGVAADPQFQSAWANALFFLGKNKEAIAKFQALAEQEPKDGAAAAWIVCGTARLVFGRYREAVDALDRARNLDRSVEGSPDYVTARVLALCGVDRHAEALKAADRLLELTLPDALALTSRGTALAGLGRHQEALDEFDKAIELCASSPAPKLLESIALIRKGGVLMTMKRPDDALAAFRNAARLAEEAGDLSNHIVALLGQGVALYIRSTKAEKEQVEALRAEALEVTTRAAELSKELPNRPIPALAWWGKGNVLSWLERDEESLAAYERASECDPDAVQIRLSLGESYDRLQDHERAIGAFTEATQIAHAPEEKSEAWRGKGRALLRLERYEDAIDACRKAIGASGETEKLLELLGRAYSALDRHDAALRTFRRGWSLGKPSQRSASLALGVSAELLTQGREAEALSFLEKAEKETRFNGQLHFNRGVALYRLKQFGPAARALREAAKLGVPGAGEHADELEGGGTQGQSWLGFWFGSAVWVRKVLGSVLVLLLVVALLPSVLKPDHAPAFLAWLDMSKDWKVMLIPIALLATLLALPNLKRVAVGKMEIEVSQPEPQVGRPDLNATLKAFIEAGASTPAISGHPSPASQR